MALNNFINKYRVYVQNIDNFIADTAKRTDKTILFGESKLNNSSNLLLSDVFP